LLSKTSFHGIGYAKIVFVEDREKKWKEEEEAEEKEFKRRDKGGLLMMTMICFLVYDVNFP